jgi:glycosyltransferase involved in cell wall biosynthesis
MRVAIVSNYPPAECGIANYTHQLVTALHERAPDVDVRLVAETLPGEASTAAVRRVWNRATEWPRPILECVEALGPDVVHIQHGISIFGHDPRLPLTVFALRARGIRTLVTLHSVYITRQARAYHRRLARAGATLIVHQHSGGADLLRQHGVPAEQIVVIPHGTPVVAPHARTDARDRLGLPHDVRIILFFGFIYYTKGLHVALSAFDRANVPEARFVVAGRLRRHSYLGDALYAWWLERKLTRNRRVIYRPGFIPVADKSLYYAAADLVVLPHRQSYGSASGVLHEALAARRPIACSRGLKFAELVERLAPVVPDACPRAGDVTGWQRAIERLLGDDTARARSLDAIDALADETSWSRSAEAHAALYRKLALRAAA